MTHPTLIPMIITRDMAATRRFYVDGLGCEVTIDHDTYLQLRVGDHGDGPQLAFMPPMPDESPLGAQHPFAGGLVTSVAVLDADAYRARLRERGVDAPDATDKPWGWRSFVLEDPNGVTLDFFHGIADTADQDASS